MYVNIYIYNYIYNSLSLILCFVISVYIYIHIYVPPKFNIAAEKLPSPPKKRSSFPTIKFSEVVEGGSSGPWYVCVFCVFLFRNDESFNQIFGASSYHTSESVSMLGSKILIANQLEHPGTSGQPF